MASEGRTDLVNVYEGMVRAQTRHPLTGRALQWEIEGGGEEERMTGNDGFSGWGE